MTQETAAAGRVTVLGINGHIGHHAAKAFAAAGWDVTGFGRSNRHPVAGVHFLAGDAASVAEIRAAVAGADVIVNALNLPYDQWFGGRMEALMARVVEAIGPRSGATMLFPANIYNYAASLRRVTPDASQEPETPRGMVRVRTEALLKAAAARGDFRLIMVRAGDFFGPESSADWFDQVMLREGGRGRFSVPGPAGVGHSWAYLPDLAAAFETLARRRDSFAQVELFHFAGHFVTPEQMAAAIRAAAPVPLVQTAFPWTMLRLLGLFMPVLREVVKMRYLWENPMQLEDKRLDAILGAGFGTPFTAAVAAAAKPYLTAAKPVAAGGRLATSSEP